LRSQQAESNKRNNGLRERQTLIEERLGDTQNQLMRLLDLYIDGQFPKDILNQRRGDLEKLRDDLLHERTTLAAHLQIHDLTDVQVEQIETFCAEVRDGLENATFEDKQRYFELLDVRGTLAFEDGKEIVYIKCKLGEQQVLQLQTLPFANIGGT